MHELLKYRKFLNINDIVFKKVSQLAVSIETDNESLVKEMEY